MNLQGVHVYFTDKQEILFDEAAFKMYKVQGKDLSGLDMNEMLLIKDELLAVAYQDGAIRLWDIKKGLQVDI